MGVRETYPADGSSIVPFVRMAYTNTGGSLTEEGYQLGIFLVKSHYTVRGRRATPLSIPMRAARLSRSDQRLMLNASKEYECGVLSKKDKNEYNPPVLSVKPRYQLSFPLHEVEGGSHSLRQTAQHKN